ncbi:MAG: DUF2029 domain-containing protein [Candidatus Rokubacteria bacterium]|nr:DUF2029 domain-containing protein [Candidatus Rokubacteria bacterium]
MENADRQASRTRRELIAAAAALLGSGGLVAACLALARVPNLVEAPRTFLVLWGLAFAAYALGAVAVQRVPGRRALGLVLLVAGGCRLALLPAPPTLSTDAYRYVWDARVARAGFSPWAYPATAPELAGLRDQAIYPRLNHPGWRSLYPPGAQAFFSAVHALLPDSVRAMKAALTLAELATLAALLWLLAALGLPLVRAAIYAWNPLVLVEVWGSAHLDALAILCVVLAVRAAVGERHALAGALLGAGALVKLYPAALLPLLVARLIGRARVAPTVPAFLGVVCLGYAPALVGGVDALGSLPRYVAEEHFNPGLVRTLLDAGEPSVAAAALWILAVAWWRRTRPLPEAAVWLVGGFVLLSPNIFPWYVLWLVPFLALAPSVAWIAFTGTVALAYTFFLQQPWAVPAWARVLEFAPLAAGAAWAVGRRIRGRALRELTPA